MAGKAIGQRVLVLDGEGFVHGIGMAERLADQGKDVTILSESHLVASYLENTRETANLQRMMNEKKIHERSMHWVEGFKIEGGKVLADILLYLSRRVSAALEAGRRWGSTASGRHRIGYPNL